MWPHRPPRVSSFDYRGLYRYLITTVTRNREAFFAEPIAAAEIVSQIQQCFTPRDFDVLAYCVMPDHVHLLLMGTSEDSDLREAIRIWKLRAGYASKSRTGRHLWQTGFHDRVLREEDDDRAVIRYIVQDPVRAGLVRSAAEYPWLGSSRYSVAELEEYYCDWAPKWR